jgi:hypothetical protein
MGNIDYSTYTRKELNELRIELKEQNKNLCLGSTCDTGQIKSIDEFSKNINTCKKCSNASIKERHKKYGRSYQRTKIELKKDKVCEVCNCDDIELLQFDHIITSEKTDNIGQMWSSSKILEEAKNTRILCLWCHRLHTQFQQQQIKQAKKYEYTSEESILDESQPRKLCNGQLCNGQLRQLEWFHPSRRELHNRFKCRKCSSIDDSYKLEESRNYVDNIKLTIKYCVECKLEVTKETVCCFDFDHIDQDNKLHHISNLRKTKFSNSLKNKIDTELSKCQLMCCICHLKKTIKQLKYYKPSTVRPAIKEVTIKQETLVNSTNSTVKPIIKPIFIKGDIENIPIKIENTKLEISSVIKNTMYKYIKTNKCTCGNDIDKDAKHCVTCSHKTRRTSNRPDWKELETDINNIGYVQTGIKYNVSDNAIRKWVKWYETYENVIFTLPPKRIRTVKQ